MENFNNNNQNQQSQPQPPQQPSQDPIHLGSSPQGGVPVNNEPPKKSGLSSWIVLVVVIALAFYFTGGWDWFQSIGSLPEEEDTEEVEENESEDGENEVSDGNNSDTSDGDVPVGKGVVSFRVLAGIPNGAVLSTGGQEPDVEIRRVSLYNPFKQDWILIYEGERPLNLTELAGQENGHELIKTQLVAMEYDKLRLEYVELVNLNEQGDQSVSRTRTVELPGVTVNEGAGNMVKIFFNPEDPSSPGLLQ